MFYARTVSFYLRDLSIFFLSVLPRATLPADIQGWLYSCCSVAKPSLPLCDPWTAVCQASFTITLSLLKLMSIESVIPSNHLIRCHPLLLLPSAFPTIRVFSKELALHIKGSKDWSFSFNISPANEYSGLTSLMIDLFDLAFQGIFRSLL